ncbi:hypothetical protein P8452_44354 [Trifolium repens]|nr:hypothetical protein P8452_44354 [Trifolium repens]
MYSKNAILILALLAMVLLISSEVSARDLTETSTDTKKEVVEQKLAGLPPRPIRPRPHPGCGQRGCCGVKFLGHCSRCCSN